VGSLDLLNISNANGKFFGFFKVSRHSRKGKPRGEIDLHNILYPLIGKRKARSP
jgi:hypothetical protein